MRRIACVLVGVAAASLPMLQTTDAAACGGCFSEPVTMQQGSRTIVTGHRMILSVSPTQTTLWDQIVYDGAPESFAWVLPTKGLVEIGLSSDVLFQRLEENLPVQIVSPVVQCGGGEGSGSSADPCGYGGGTGGGGNGGPSGGAFEDKEDPVEVLAHAVVGPYETVQLSSQDPAALQAWLTSHGYEVPADVAPIIDAYVAEGFDFVALKLVPGASVNAMRPVRVTAPGAAPMLPLRMTAAGTGAFTPMTLFVVGEGRYEPQNFPSFTIPASQMFWDWNTSSSNYVQLRGWYFEQSDHHAWSIDVAVPFSAFPFEAELRSFAAADPSGSGYADDMGGGAEAACEADLFDLFGTLDPGSLWITRMTTELSKAALALDLQLGAAGNQSAVSGVLNVPYGNQLGNPCGSFDCHEPPYDDDDPSSGSEAGDGGGGCACGFAADAARGSAIASGVLTLIVALARRRGRPR